MTKHTNERLVISNFLVIQGADIEIKDITVLIGPQANGKSIIAKLTYFFRNFLSEIFTDSIRKHENKSDIEKTAKEKFISIFPSYAWKKESFVIYYFSGDHFVNVENKGSLSSFRIDYSEELKSIHRKTKAELRKILGSTEKQTTPFTGLTASYLDEQFSIDQAMRKYGLEEEPFSRGLFIPAGRSFFAFLQQNLFSFLRQSGIVDTLIADFGSFYETVKNITSGRQVRPYELLSKKMSFNKHSIKLLEELERSILLGEYIRDDDKDWIKSGGRTTNVANVSSGQQESLPLLLALKFWPLISGTKGAGCVFIEEPEAHLFPESQKSIVELISTIHNLTSTKFFITTHSPYILTTLNTLIYAGNLINEGKIDQVKKVLKSEAALSSCQVSAYSIDNKIATNIFDTENNLIDAEVIDQISDKITTEFDELMDIE